MLRKVLTAGAGAALVAASLSLVVPPAANAAVTASCNFGQFPVTEGSASNLQVACVATGGATGQQLDDYAYARWHSGAARDLSFTVTSSGTTGSGFTTTAVITAGCIYPRDVNHVVASTALPQGEFISSTPGSATCTVGATFGLEYPVAAGKTIKVKNALVENGVGRNIRGDSSHLLAADFYTTDGNPAVCSGTCNYVGFEGATVTAGSKVLTAPFGNFKSTTDVGMRVDGTDIAPGTVVASVTSATQIMLSENATGTTIDPTWDTADQFSGNDYTGSDFASFQPVGPCGKADTKIGHQHHGCNAGNVAATPLNPTPGVQAASAGGEPISLSGVNTSGTEANIEASTARIVFDASWSANGTTITSTNAHFKASDLGLPVFSGKAFGKTGSTITTVNSATQVTVATAALTASNDPKASPYLAIGLPSATAPANGSPVMQLATELALSPALVDGAQPCSANAGAGAPTGALLQGVWENPASSVLVAPKGQSLFFGAVDTNQLTDPIAQIAFNTPVVGFSGWVQEDTSGNYHVVLPFLPTTLGICPGTSTSEVSTVTAESVNQANLPTGYGRPDSVFVRALSNITGGTSTASVSGTADINFYLAYTAGGTPSDTETSTSCSEVRAAQIDTLAHAFPCGNG